MAVNNGGVIGKINTPTTSLASGVWSLGDQFESQSSEIWPLAFPLKGIGNACRFDDGSTDYLARTPSSTGNRDTFTISTWVKRANLGTIQTILASYSNAGGIFYTKLNFNSDDTLQFMNYPNVYSGRTLLITNQVFRDVSAWYHIVLRSDTTDATASERTKIYVNGEQITSFSEETQPSQNKDSYFNTSGIAMQVGNEQTQTRYLDGYLSEVVFLDGQALTPSSFGATDPVSGIWCPKAISTTALTFGTNGFYLDFANSGALGTDVSGNGNNFTVNNLTSIDQTTDTAVNNYATMNVSDNYYASSTFSEGNLKIVTNASNETFNTATIPMFSGKWYWEIKVTSGQPREFIGITDVVTTSSSGAYSDAPKARSYYSFDGQSVTGSTGDGAYGATYGTGDIMGVALDIDNGYLYFSKNGTFQNSGDPTSGATGTGGLSISSSPTNGYWLCQVGEIYTGSSTFEVNFGNPTFTISSSNSDANGYGNFEYAVPSGYYALNSKNLAEFG